MGIKELTTLEKSDAVMATQSRELALLGTAEEVGVVVDVLTRFFSFWAEIQILEDMTVSGYLMVLKKFVDRLALYFEYVGLCFDYASPEAKRVEQAGRSKKSRALPLNATERSLLLDEDGEIRMDGLLYPLQRIRLDRDIFRKLRTLGVRYLMVDYELPEDAICQQLFVMGWPEEPTRLQVVARGGERLVYECPPIMEGDGQVVWLADQMEMPVVVVSNDRDVLVMLRARWLLHRPFRQHLIIHMRCNERLTTFLNGKWSKYKPDLAEKPLPMMEPDNAPLVNVMFGFGTTVTEFVGQKRTRATDSDPGSKRAKTTGGKKKSRCIYETPFADIGAQMRTVFSDPREFWAASWLGFMFGCDFVHKSNWVKGTTADYAWGQLAPSQMDFVEVGGPGPYGVTVHTQRLKTFLEGVFDSKPKMAKRPGAMEYAGTIRRTLWTMLYMLNQSFYNEAVPDPLETTPDGTSVWGWKKFGTRVRETDVVSETLPVDCLGKE